MWKTAADSMLSAEDKSAGTAGQPAIAANTGVPVWKTKQWECAWTCTDRVYEHTFVRRAANRNNHLELLGHEDALRDVDHCCDTHLPALRKSDRDMLHGMLLRC